MHLDESIRQFFEHSIGNPRLPRHRWGRWGQQHQAHTGVRSWVASEPILTPNLSDSKLPYYFVGRSLQRHRVRLPVWRGRGSTWLVVMRDLDSKCRLGGRSKNKFFPVFANHWLGTSFLQPSIPAIHFFCVSMPVCTSEHKRVRSTRKNSGNDFLILMINVQLFIHSFFHLWPFFWPSYTILLYLWVLLYDIILSDTPKSRLSNTKDDKRRRRLRVVKSL